mmetsp:Transcript_19015/g.47236  ORF Transcript_19015/g.47236 Transcript_19015/m.47236 type:complete len:166 (+) Transcript_19015:179-676(+)|eukprot:CAMPEP_0116098930 /NCGR_PEP_ID=MMETSP0327-20121206/11496_1 /TAXON_ID=44447 /ORGANISM="Pseudo-nitzschia delicatissima, Strain B596" /LENGTH=165 /DNA_ID=CAMNT_0003590771 /DNA_START=645 /DNA_END=1142 /DNA_ORIENTATION=-
MTAQEEKPSLRVKVINSDSGLSKDMLVEVRTGFTLFDAIYNTETLKKANVRKWSSSVTQNVKSGTHEIKCEVKSNGTETSLHSYSVNDLKITSTKQLYTLLGGGGEAMVTLELRCAEKPKGKPAFDHSALLKQSGQGKMMKCPFSGMEFDEDALKEFLKHKNASS